VSWEGFGLRICMAVDSNVIFANIQPEYMWGYFSQTLVFAFSMFVFLIIVSYIWEKLEGKTDKILIVVASCTYIG
jgi:hypothetical protein